MHIWLINSYGPIPSEAWRDYRFAIFGHELAKSGHSVIWWTSNYSHHFKRFRSRSWTDITVCPNFVIRLVPTNGYRRNIGFGRLIKDAQFSAKTYYRGRQEARPDCIISAESPITFGYAGFRLAKKHHAKLIYDQMDLWPELFEAVTPARIRGVAHGLLMPIYASRRRTYQSIDGVVALSRRYLESVFGVNPKLRDKPNAVVYNGIDVEKMRNSMLRGVHVDMPSKAPREMWAIFAGSLGPSYDIRTLINVARACADAREGIRIIVAGDGPMRGLVSEAALSCSMLSFVGQLNPAALACLYSKCDIGIAAYSSGSNVEMPDKFYDYMAAGLPTVCSLSGEVSEIIKHSNVGTYYCPGNVASLRNALAIIRVNATSGASMRSNALRLATEFDVRVQCAKLREVLAAVCSDM